MNMARATGGSVGCPSGTFGVVPSLCWTGRIDMSNDSHVCHVCCCCCCPAATQAQGVGGRPVKYSGMGDVIRHTYSNEGLRGFYKVCLTGICLKHLCQAHVCGCDAACLA